MALFVKQDDNRSQLQEKIASELREKIKKQSELNNKGYDGIEDSAYMKNTKKTTGLAFVWLLVVLLFIGAMIYVIFIS